MHRSVCLHRYWYGPSSEIYTEAVEKKCSCCLVAIPATGEDFASHPESVITCESVYSKKMHKMFLKVEKVKS